jgi:hypothetical protein
MRDSGEFRTETGVARVRGDELVVERTVGSVLRGWYEANVQRGGPRGTLKAISALLFPATVFQFLPMLFDGFQPTPVEWVALAMVILLPGTVALKYYRDVLRATRVPLREVERVEVDPGELTLTVVRTEGSRALSIPFVDENVVFSLGSEADLAAARRTLQLHGIAVGLPGEHEDDDSGHRDPAARDSSAGDRDPAARDSSAGDAVAESSSETTAETG